MTKPDSAPRSPVPLSTAPVAGASMARMGGALQPDDVGGVDARKHALRERRLADGRSDAPSADEAPPADEAPQDMPMAEAAVQPVDTGDHRDDDAAAAVVPAPGSTEKSIAAMMVWLVGATLAAGSKIFLSDEADRARPEPSLPPQPQPKPDPQPQPKPDPQPEPKPDPQPEPRPEPQPQPQPQPQPKPQPEPARAPDAPTLSLHSPGATADGLLGAGGEIRVEGLTSGARWEYSLDQGKTWYLGLGATLSPTLFGEDGVKSLQVVQIDAAGLRSAARGLDFILDAHAPAPSLALINDTGTPGDGVTSEGALAVDALEPGVAWSYRIDDGGWRTGAADGRIDDAELGTEGRHQVEVRQTDAAGNVGVAQIAVTVDRSVAAPSLALTRDTGAGAGDRVTREARVSVGGLEPGAVWEFSADGVHWSAGSGDAIPASVFGGDGVKQVWVRQTDAAGNVSETSTLGFTLDTTVEAPAASIRSAAREHFAATRRDGSDFYGANSVNAHSWLQVDVEAGATWTYRIDGGNELAGRGGRIDLAGLSDGAHELRIRQLDLAGNLSDEQVLQVAVDNVAPVASGRWTTKPDTRDMSNFGWTMHTDEAAQFVAIPVATANDGTAQSYLENGRASLRPLVSDGKDAWAWFEEANEMYVVLAIDTAGNASFVQMRGSTTPDSLSVSSVEGRSRTNPPDLNIETATFDAGLQAWVARATYDKTDHLYGTSHADRFDFGAMTGTSRSSGIDWIHGYNQQQGDVIQLNDRDLQSLPVGAKADDLARYFRKEILADGTISLWIDVDGAGKTSPTDFDHRILVSAEQGTSLSIHLANGGAFVI